MIKTAVRRFVRRTGFDLVRYSGRQAVPLDFDQEAIKIVRAVEPYTMTSFERLFALIQAVRYVVRAGVPGDIVECGVWRGGSMMAVAHTLKVLGNEDLNLYLFDTYEGMPRPSDLDIDYEGEPAVNEFERTKRTSDSSEWCYADLEQVRRNLASTGYRTEKLQFIKGKVEETIPGFAPDQISILRLDTDWYESTRHELVHLFPRLAVGGVLIIDDYGYWQGSRKATDEYLAQNRIFTLLNRVDNTGRIAVKT